MFIDTQFNLRYLSFSGSFVSTWVKYYCTYQREPKRLTMVLFDQKSGGKIVSPQLVQFFSLSFFPLPLFPFLFTSPQLLSIYNAYHMFRDHIKQLFDNSLYGQKYADFSSNYCVQVLSHTNCKWAFTIPYIHSSQTYTRSRMSYIEALNDMPLSYDSTLAKGQFVKFLQCYICTSQMFLSNSA